MNLPKHIYIHVMINFAEMANNAVRYWFCLYNIVRPGFSEDGLFIGIQIRNSFNRIRFPIGWLAAGTTTYNKKPCK